MTHRDFIAFAAKGVTLWTAFHWGSYSNAYWSWAWEGDRYTCYPHIDGGRIRVESKHPVMGWAW